MSSFLSRLFNKLKPKEKKQKSGYFYSQLTPEKLIQLEKVIGCSIKNKSYFKQALIHRSFLEQSTEHDSSNERLEFLGDSVLNMVVAEFLFNKFPDEDEGFLTKIRARLVNRSVLADSAERINLSNLLLVSKNFSNYYTNGSRTVLSDAFEAIIGAIYLDSGLHTAKNFILKNLIEPTTFHGEYLVDENYKSQLLEYAQANKLDIPSYVVVSEEGPQHDRTFTIKVLIGSKEYGRGKGRNKKSAEQHSAKAAMRRINRNEKF